MIPATQFSTHVLSIGTECCLNSPRNKSGDITNPWKWVPVTVPEHMLICLLSALSQPILLEPRLLRNCHLKIHFSQQAAASQPGARF